jgi:dolichyl-phosphate-mannose--protein O-mannosyl transferase
VIWPVGAMMVLTFVLVVFYMRYQREPGLDIGSHFKKYVAVVAFGTVAYSLNLLPYVGVKRSCFAYHYMPALMYAELVTPITMDRVFGPKYMGLATKLLLVLYTAGFLYFAPWIYALPLSADEHAARRWLRRWD